MVALTGCDSSHVNGDTSFNVAILLAFYSLAYIVILAIPSGHMPAEECCTHMYIEKYSV